MPKVETCDLRVRDIIEARPAVRETVVRTIGPAAIFVCEADSPARLVLAALSDGELRSVVTWLRENEDASGFARAYSNARTGFDGGEDVEAVEREREHEQLLESGEPLPIGRVV
jgi:hypothetical protein